MGVALITPFKSDKSIDYEALERLVEYQVASSADYLVVLGTTAETPTLSQSERDSLRDIIRRQVAGRVPLVIGMGGNCTDALCREIRAADLEGYSALLSVVPYYNKPSQEGIFQHYRCVAEASPLPVILYNVPGRTGQNMTADTTLRLAAEVPGIIGVKEASGKLDQIEEILRRKPEGFQVVSGDDAATFSLLSMGAVGVISVIGNAFPREFSRMVHLCLEGRFEEASPINEHFSELFRLLFVDGNPAGVKCTLHELGMIQNELRLPLVPTRISTAEKIHNIVNCGK